MPGSAVFRKLFNGASTQLILMSTAAQAQKDVLSQIRPNKDQKRKISAVARRTLALAGKFARKYRGKAMLAGSITRDTWLPDKMEFDVFVLFPEKMNDKQMERAGLEIGKKVIESLKGKWELTYAQHPYVSGMVEGVDIDIVPAFDVKSAENIKSAVDRTPFHVKFVEKHLSSRQSDDVRLLKQMLKSTGAYGADTKTDGFSGYVCELLVIQYKGFAEVLKAARKWEAGEIIDMSNSHKKSEYESLRKQFADQVLILVDPTDKNRNTAAALSARNFFKMKKLAEEFLSKPSSEIFFGRKFDPITEQELNEYQMRRRTELLVVKFLPPKGVDDVVWPQMRKFAERLQGILEESKYEFKVMGKDVFTDGSYVAAVLLEMEVSKLPTVQKRVGPSVFDKDDAKRFLEKYTDAIAGPYVEGTNWVVETNRQFVTAREKIQDSLAKPIEELLAKGVPKLVAERIAKGFDVFSETDRTIDESRRNPAFGSFIRKYFEKEKLA